MSSSRDRILKRLRQDQPEPLQERRYAPEPPREHGSEERISRFRRLLEAVRAEVHLCGRDEWAKHLRQLAQEKAIGNLLYGAGGPLSSSLESAWKGHEQSPQLISRQGPLDDWKDELFSGIEASVTSARWGIAETGTLVLWPTPEEPRSLSLVPPIHFAVLDASGLHDSFDQLVEQEQWRHGMPSNALLISGPSKTADIEQTLAYGIHGPVELIVLLTH